MSALGQKRTFAVQNGMSALPPKADMSGVMCMSAKCQKRTLARNYSITSSAAKSRPGGIVTPSAFAVLRLTTVELGRRLYRKIGWLVAAQDTVDGGRQRLCMGTGWRNDSTTASWRRWDGAEWTRKR